MDIWRQAYMSYPTGKKGKGKRVLRPAVKLFTTDLDSISLFMDNLKKRTNHAWERDGKYTYCGLKLLDNEIEANAEVLDINNLKYEK